MFLLHIELICTVSNGTFVSIITCHLCNRFHFVSYMITYVYLLKYVYSYFYFFFFISLCSISCFGDLPKNSWASPKWRSLSNWSVLCRSEQSGRRFSSLGHRFLTVIDCFRLSFSIQKKNNNKTQEDSTAARDEDRKRFPLSYSSVKQTIMW